MHPERAQRAQRPETLFVVRELPVSAIGPLSRALKPLIREGLRPRIVTQREIERGADVFALELAEWKARHWLIEGTDPFAAIEIHPADLRHAIEFNLRGLGRRLRNRVLVSMATSDGQQEASRAVLDALDSLTIVAYHTLVWLEDKAPPLDSDVLRRLGTVLTADVDAVITVLEDVRRDGTVRDPIAAVAAVLPLVEAITDAVDRLDDRTGAES